jgi:hypothetical protein
MVQVQNYLPLINMSENKIIMKTHYYAHSAQLLCVHKITNIDIREIHYNGSSVSHFLFTVCAIITFIFNSVMSHCDQLKLTINDLCKNNNHNYTMTCRVYVTNHNKE